MRFLASHTENCELGTQQLQGYFFSDKRNKRTYLDIFKNGKVSQEHKIEFIVFIQMNA